MEFIRAEYLEEIKTRPFERALDNYSCKYSKIDLFNDAKEVMLLAHLSKQTWYSIMEKIQAKSINSKDQFLWTSMPLNLMQIVHEIFIESGELLDTDDIRSIAYTYEDYCIDHPELAIHEHFALQNFVKDLYRLKVNQFLAEVLCLSDFVILKMCPKELMNAQIVTIETAIKYAKQENDIKTALAIADYGISILVEDTFTYKYCSNFIKRNKKN